MSTQRRRKTPEAATVSILDTARKMEVNCRKVPLTKRKKPAAKKNLPVIFSHDFFIEYHSEIATFVVLMIIVFLTVQATSPVFSVFTTMHYGQYSTERDVWETYGTGLKDLFNIIFLIPVCIILHDLVQELILDTISHVLQLSKSKHSEFNESGQLIVFYTVSIIWALCIITDKYWFTNFSLLWTGYSQNTMSVLTKLFYIFQLSYWAHIVPELYFQRIKKEEMINPMKYSILYLAFISIVYISNFHCIGILILCLHYVSEFIKHTVKLIDITEKNENSKRVHSAQNVYNWLFFAIQLSLMVLSQTTIFYYTLNSLKFSGELHLKTLLFNLFPPISALFMQVWILYEFFSEHKSISLKMSAFLGILEFKPKTEIKDSSNNKRKNTKNNNGADQKIDRSIEVDQNVKQTLKNRVKQAAKNA